MKLLRIPLALFLLGVATVVAAPADSSRLALDISANGAVETQIYQGSPLLVHALLTLWGGESVRLDSGGKPWTASLKLELRDSRDKPVSASWQLLGATVSPFTLTREAGEAAAIFGLGPAATQRLASGSYTLLATLDMKATAAPGAWNSRAQSQTVRILLSPRPQTLSPEQSAWEHRLTARWMLLKGKPEESLAELNLVLARDPDDIDALSEKADALTELRRYAEAEAAMERALAAFPRKTPGATHPPRLLLRQLEDIRAASSPPAPAISNGKASAPAAAKSSPASSPPPAAVGKEASGAGMTSLDEYNRSMQKADALFAAGNYWDAVRAYEQAGRIAYRNKLNVDPAHLAEKLARARKARDEKKK